MEPAPLILASTSPYRRSLLARLRIPFTCAAPAVEEHPLEGESPSGTATRLATAKALAVAKRHADALVIGSDQVASIDGVPYGKPGETARARQQLQRSSGRCVQFDTAVTLAKNGTTLDTCSVPYHVQFRPLTDREINRYLELDQPLDCAGSFRWERLGIALFASLRGDDPPALEGLPLIALTAMLSAQGLNPLDLPSP